MLPLIPLIGALGSAVIGAGAQVGVTSMQNKNSRMLQEDAQAFEAAQAELAYDRQVEFYEKYQSPYAQIESAKKAGINPFSLGGSSSSGSAGSAPMASSGISSTPSVPNIGAFFSGLYEQIQEIKNRKAIADADVNLKNAEADKIRTEIPWIDRLSSVNYDKLASDIKFNEQKINESIQSVKESVSRVSVNDSTIEVNGSKISLNSSQENLNILKSFVESLNAQKLSLLMPYVESAQKARIDLDNATSESARASSYKSYSDASFTLLKKSVELDLIDKGYYDSLVQKSEYDAKSTKRNFKWTPVQNVVHDMSLIAVGVGSVLSGVARLN